MKHAGMLLGAVCLGFVLSGAALAGAPGGAPNPEWQKGPAAAFPKGGYRALDSLPDWGGVWFGMGGGPGGAQAERPQPKGKYLAELEALRKLSDANNGVIPIPASTCTPPGMPGAAGASQYPVEFLFTPGRVTFLNEAWTQERRIYTDGRPHPPADELEYGFYGHSIGKWEGDTLVVHTIGVKDTTRLATGLGHSDKMEINERMRLDPSNPNVLINDMVITDPEALEKPWTRQFRYRRDRTQQLMEFICAENNRNGVDEKGFVQFD